MGRGLERVGGGGLENCNCNHHPHLHHQKPSHRCEVNIFWGKGQKLKIHRHKKKVIRRESFQNSWICTMTVLIKLAL